LVERCHGPGERHIETAEQFDIVNPKKLTTALSDAVCEQCHLEGWVRVLPHGRDLYDFRPGLPLADFWSVFVSAGEPGENRRAVTHVEQMHESRCYQNSSGDNKLSCISCHNPHQYVRPSQRVASYRASCLACHENQGCTLPRPVRIQTSKEDSCIDCHMPRQSTAGVAHIAATDHRILRHARSRTAKETLWIESRGGWLLAPFGRDRVDLTDNRLVRDLGIALIEAARLGQVPERLAAAQALVLFERASTDNDDIDAWEARGWTLLLQDMGAEQDGSYTVRGVPLGAVEITVETDSVRLRSAVQGGSKQGGSKSQPPKMMQDKMKQFGEAEEAKVIQNRLAAEEAEKERRYVQIPPQYSDPARTDLRYVVTSGKQQHDIDLK